MVKRNEWLDSDNAPEGEEGGGKKGGGRSAWRRRQSNGFLVMTAPFFECLVSRLCSGFFFSLTGLDCMDNGGWMEVTSVEERKSIA